MKLFIPLLLGTKRPGRQSEKVAKFMLNILQTKFSDSIETILVDPKDLNLPDDGVDIKDPKYSEITARADGFLIVTPEYNHSIPGTLKRMLDSEFGNYHRKSVAIVGVSDGPWGGVRAIEALIHVTKALGLANIRFDLQFPKTPELFDENENILDRAIEPRAVKLIEELLWLTKALKWGRENVK